MKKNLQFLTVAAALLLSGAAAAQSSRTVTPYGGNVSRPALPSSSATPEAVTCGPDALDYVYSKVDTLGMDSLFYFELWPAEKTSTAYANTESINVSDIFVYGKVKTGDAGPATMEVSLWNVDSNWQPTTMIPGATATLNIAQATAPAYHLFSFTTPVAISDSFAVVLTNNDAGTDDFWAIGSDGDPVTGPWLEGLSFYDWQGFWEPMVDVYSGIGEGLLIPVVDYSVSTMFTTAANDTVCVGSPVSFTNTSSPLYWNRFFNLHAFSEQMLGENDSTFMWNYGDSSGDMYTENGMHTYSAPGMYTVSLTGTMLGYLDTCMETMTWQVVVLDNPASSFTYDASMEPMVSFMDASTGTTGATYMWDFGDGNTSMSQNPTHTYGSNGTYTVTQTVMGFCGNSTTTQTVTITTVGVNDVASLDVKALYNANEQMLNVTLPGSANATLEVYNAVGSKIFAESGVNTAVKQISLNGLSNGTYMVRVITSNGIGATKFVVIK